MKKLLLATAFAIAAFTPAQALSDRDETIIAMSLVKLDLYEERCAPLSRAVSEYIDIIRPSISSAKYLAAMSQLTSLLRERIYGQEFCPAMKETMWKMEKLAAEK